MSSARIPPSKRPALALAKLRGFALAFEGAWEDHPWGETVFKVGTKVFVFSNADAESFGLSVKLPTSRDAALTLPFAEPTGYGLGKSGWVSARFPGGKDVPWPVLEAWLNESYAAVAPKRSKPTKPVARAARRPAPKRRK